jgi:hypothetical protein
VQKSAQMLSKAPAAKKALERFVFEVKAFFCEVGDTKKFWVGNLKNRDLSGAVVPSQARPRARALGRPCGCCLRATLWVQRPAAQSQVLIPPPIHTCLHAV